MNRQQTMYQQVQAYLEYRRALGFDLRITAFLLRQFARFVDRSGHRGPLTTGLILRWVDRPKTAATTYKANRLSAARGFARYLAARDGQTEVPDWRLIPKTFHRRPYIFDDRQLEQLLVAAGQMMRMYQLRPLTYRTLFGLLASTGLRICEALKLTCGHVDLTHGVLRIARTKFKKSRLVPLHPTATRALCRYAVARHRQWGQCDDEPFFVGQRGLALPYGTVLGAFRTLCVKLGWHGGNGERPRPRLHDLRHSFACRCLLRWSRNREDINQRIAALSTYLGHGKVTDTYWYLTGTPELMAIAGNRFERFAHATKGERS